MTHHMLCPICAQGQLHADSVPNTISVDLNSVEVARLFHWCDNCGAEIALDSDVRENARVTLCVRQRARGKLTGAQIKSLREDVLKISQADASKIFGGGPVAFSKYENNETPPSDAMDNLLWLVCQHTNLAYELAARSNVEIKRPSIRSSVSSIPEQRSKAMVAKLRVWQLNSGISCKSRATLVDAITTPPINKSFGYERSELEAAA